MSLITQASNDKANLTEVSVQLKWRHQFQFAGYYAAIEKGFYRDNGLKVNVLERESGPTPIEKLILGHVDYAIGGVGAIVYRVNDIPLVALATIFQHSPSILISRYSTLAELKQKKVMLTEGIMNSEIVAMFKKGNISLSELDIVYNEKLSNDFVAGKHDAYNGYATNEPYYLDALNTPYYVFKPTEYDVDFYGDVLLTTEKKIASDIEQVKNFRAATIQGWEYAIKHVDEVVDIIYTKYNSQNKTKEHLTFEAHELIKLIYDDIVPLGYMNEQRWLDIVTTLKNLGELKDEEINIKRFIFTNHLNQNVLNSFRYYLTEILILLALMIGLFLLIHNYRLKIMVKNRTQALNKAMEQAELEARTDNLTKLANRRHFMESFEQALSLAQRNNLELSVIYIDIDYFKKINDSYGHAAGDKTLKAIASILTKNIRASDTVARIGGEEFVIVCLEKDKMDACYLADRIREEVEKHVFSYKKQEFKVTISLGVTTVENAENNISQILKKADEALYRAKDLGRNQVQCT